MPAEPRSDHTSRRDASQARIAAARAVTLVAPRRPPGRAPSHTLAHTLAHTRARAPALVAAALLMAGCPAAPPAPDAGALGSLEVPAEHEDGRSHFVAHCAACHGELALGTEQGPPLVHRVYRPLHHGDEAFQLAVAQGVRAHHWRFGDMPPVPGLGREQVSTITGYIRWLQRAAGIE